MEDLVDRWLRLMSGPKSEGPEACQAAVREMQALGADAVFPMLEARLSDLDPNVHCNAIEALARVDLGRAVDRLIPLLSRPEWYIRITVCDALSSPAASAATEPLMAVLECDPDPQVRGYAARALGLIGCRSAIPALLKAMDDHEVDILGYTPSHCAAMALDDMMETHYTRIRLSPNLCTMRPGPPDLDGLRAQALHEYEEWRSGREAEDGPTG